MVPADRERIFSRFYRESGHPTTPGAGVGLAIVAEYAASMSGRVSVGIGCYPLATRSAFESEIRQLGVGAPSPAARRPVSATVGWYRRPVGSSVDAVVDAAPDLTILIVDDDADMRFLARAVLEGSNIRVADEAANGAEALQKVRELGPPPVPTVVLLDNQMPGLSGLEVAAHILADVPEQLIILFSACLSDEIIAEAERRGVAACVSKGNALDLASIVRDLVAARGA